MNCTRTGFFSFFSFGLLGKGGRDYLSKPGGMIVARHVTQGCFGKTSPVKGVLVFQDGVKRRTYRIANVVRSVPVGARVHCGLLVSCGALPG